MNDHGSTMSSTSTLVAATAGNVSPTRDELITLSQDLQQEISSLVRNYTADRDKMKQALQEEAMFFQQAQKTGTLNNSGANNVLMVASLRQSLNQVLQQNAKLRARLQKIHLDADISDIPAVS